MNFTRLKFAFIAIAFVLASTAVVLYQSKEMIEIEKGGEAMEEDIQGRFAWQEKMMADPATGKVPTGIRSLELAFAQTLPVTNDGLSKSDYGIWVQRGPGNVGGRTRAIAIDKTNENILLAGATAGGMWRSEDRGASWYRTSVDTDYIPATCIAQDPRLGKRNTWYVGTGELYGSSLPGGYIYGYGMRKSTDGGKTWQRLASTFSPNPQFDLSFDFVHRVAVNAAIDSLDVVFAATFDGIYRSTDGGKTFIRKRGGSGSASSYWTDVAVTKTGIVYAAISSGGGHAGIWRSTNNGQTFVNISPTWFSSNIGRIVMCLAPSDENQIYFTAYSPGTGKKTINFNGDEEWNSLWKYTYTSGDGTGNGGIWEDRSANMPSGLPGDFGEFISQQGYSLHIDVKSDNADMVFLGGTNLYRSTDGFKTSTNTTQVGGYAYGTKRPDYKMYPNHHPDQHGVIFFPSNPKEAISVDDGGIQYTSDCAAQNLSWESLNHGYVTTQFYSVAIDHTSTNPIIIGGLQDNGTQLCSTIDYKSPWVMPYSSDGSHCFVGANANEYYVSIQQGRVSRIILDNQYKLVQMARIDPNGLDKNKYQFINPFAVDVNNWKRVFIPNGNKLWRNNDVSQIPLHNQIDSNAVLTGWEELAAASLPDSTDEITAITSSVAQSDVVFFATMRGKLFKMTNASTTNPIVTNITGSNFPAAYINCITTHPNDSNKLYCVFSNYAILSAFYSNDGGLNWTAISGNLEQNTNGSGNGPSCRWLIVVPLADSTLYFLGTSTGLFATGNLNGMNTVWNRQGPNSIGLNMVTMMDFRSTDNTLAVSTYGAGVFTATLSSKDRTAINETSKLNSLEIYPNPATDKLFIQLLELKATLKVEVYNNLGQMVKQKDIGLTRSIDINELNSGIYFVKISTGKATITKRIVINE